MKRAPVWLALALLAACAGTPPVPQAPIGPAVDPGRLTEWVASGRIGVTSPGSGGSGTFTWRQRGGRTELSVRGPLGAGGLWIEANGTALSVTDANGERVDAEAARELMRTRLGTELPVAQLRYWMLGLAAPGAEARIEREGEGPVQRIEQSGWEVAYERFVSAEGWAVPARWTARSGGLRVRAVIDHWQLAPPAAVGGNP